MKLPNKNNNKMSYPIYRIDFIVKDRGLEHKVKSLEVAGYNKLNAEYHLKAFYRKNRHSMDLSTRFELHIESIKETFNKSSVLGVQ